MFARLLRPLSSRTRPKLSDLPLLGTQRRHFSPGMGEDTILVYGGAGGLGRGIIEKFSSAGWRTLNVDVFENPEANYNLLVSQDMPWEESVKHISSDIYDQSLSPRVIVNAAGGWMGGTISDDNMFETVETMFQQNLYSAFGSGYLASHHLQYGGLFVLTGAQAVIMGESTSGMIAYGAAKSGVHHLVHSLSEDEGFTKKCNVIGILPNVIDTQANRKAMPDADHNEWTRPGIFANAILHWAVNGEECDQFPQLKHGHLYRFKTLVNGRSVADYIDEVETSYRYMPEASVHASQKS